MGVFSLCNVNIWTKWASWPIPVHWLVLWNTAESNLDAEISWREGRDVLCRALPCAVHRSHPGARVLPARAQAAHISHSSILPSHSPEPAAKPGLDLPGALCPKNLPVAQTSGADFRLEPRMRQEPYPLHLWQEPSATHDTPLSEMWVMTHVMSIELWIYSRAA